MSQQQLRLSNTSSSQIVPISYPPAEVVIVGETGGSLSEAFRKRQKLLSHKPKSTKPAPKPKPASQTMTLTVRLDKPTKVQPPKIPDIEPESKVLTSRSNLSPMPTQPNDFTHESLEKADIDSQLRPDGSDEESVKSESHQTESSEEDQESEPSDPEEDEQSEKENLMESFEHQLVDEKPKIILNPKKESPKQDSPEVAEKPSLKSDDDVMKAIAAIGQSFGLENKEFYQVANTPQSNNTKSKSNDNPATSSPKTDTTSPIRSPRGLKQPEALASPKEKPSDLLKKRMEYGKKAGASLRQQIVDKLAPKRTLSPEEISAQAAPPAKPHKKASNPSKPSKTKHPDAQPVPPAPKTTTGRRQQPTQQEQRRTNTAPGLPTSLRQKGSTLVLEIAPVPDKHTADALVRKGLSIAGREKAAHFDLLRRTKDKTGK